MKEFDNYGLEEVLGYELVAIDGGSEVSDALVRGFGWVIGQAVNLAETVGRGAKYVYRKNLEMIIETGGLPHACYCTALLEFAISYSTNLELLSKEALEEDEMALSSSSVFLSLT